jgi:hypothetical protein
MQRTAAVEDYVGAGAFDNISGHNRHISVVIKVPRPLESRQTKADLTQFPSTSLTTARHTDV